MNHVPEVIKFVFDVLTTLFVGFSFLIIIPIKRICINIDMLVTILKYPMDQPDLKANMNPKSNPIFIKANIIALFHSPLFAFLYLSLFFIYKGIAKTKPPK